MQKVFYLIGELLGLIYQYPELCLRLYLQSSQTINNISNNSNLIETSYDFISQALVLYQDELSDSDQKKAAIKLITSTISHMTHFDAENFDTLSTNAAQYCQKLLKRPDQSEAVTGAVHMFNNETFVSPLNLSPTLTNSLSCSRRT